MIEYRKLPKGNELIGKLGLGMGGIQNTTPDEIEAVIREAVANEIILLRKGVVLEMQKPASLLEHLNGQVWLVTVPAADEAALTKQYTCSNVMHTDGNSVIRLLSESAPRPDAVPTTPNMEDLYLYYFGR